MGENLFFDASYPACDLELYFDKNELDSMELIEKIVKFNSMKNYFSCKAIGKYYASLLLDFIIIFPFQDLIMIRLNS